MKCYLRGAWWWPAGRSTPPGTPPPAAAAAQRRGPTAAPAGAQAPAIGAVRALSAMAPWYLQAGTPLRRCIPGTGQLPGDGALTGGPASLARRPSLPPLYRRETGPSAPAGLPDRSDEPCRVCPLEGLPAARPPPSGAPAAGAPLGEAVGAEAGLHGSPTQLLPSLPVVQLQLQDTVPPPAALQAEPRSQDPGLLIACRCEPAGAAQPVETPPVVKGAGWLPAEAGLLAALRAQSPKASAREPLSAELAAPESQILRFQC